MRSRFVHVCAPIYRANPLDNRADRARASVASRYSAARGVCRFMSDKLPVIYSLRRTFRGSERTTTSHNDSDSSTTLAPTPRHRRLTTVGGWCDPIPQPFLSRFSSRRVCFRRFYCTKTLGWQNMVFWAQNQQRTQAARERWNHNRSTRKWNLPYCTYGMNKITEVVPI